MGFGCQFSGCRQYRAVPINHGMKTPRGIRPRDITEPNGRQRAGRVGATKRRSSAAVARRFAAWAWRGLAVGWFGFGLMPIPGSAEVAVAETNAPALASDTGVAETNFLRTLEAIRELHEQLQSNQLAITRTAEEVRAAAAGHAALLSNGLQSLEQSLAAQRETLSAQNARELEALQASNRSTLIVGGTFAALASLAALIIAYFQWRMSKAWANLAAGLPRAYGTACDAVLASAGEGQPQPALEGAPPDSTQRLLGSLEQLERRISQLEQLSAPAPPGAALDPAAGGNGGSEGNAGNPDRIAALLQEGKALLKAGDWEGAIARFDEVLTLNPNHGEALLKKGTALERLQKLHEAFECYDRAIAVNDSMALAYLHKGGLYNRLERFKEALECYEKALQTHDDRHA